MEEREPGLFSFAFPPFLTPTDFPDKYSLTLAGPHTIREFREPLLRLLMHFSSRFSEGFTLLGHDPPCQLLCLHSPRRHRPACFTTW